MPRYQGKLSRSIEERPFPYLLDFDLWIEGRRKDARPLGLDCDDRTPPASFSLAEFAVERDYTPAVSFAIEDIPNRFNKRGKSFRID